MKHMLLLILAASPLLLSGCGDPAARAKEKKANPAFMFWCFRQEIVSDDFHIPDMATSAAATYIQNHLKTVPGYDSSSTDLAAHTITVSYKSSTIRKMNFEEAIALSGFSVNDRPANPKAKIPQGVK